MEAFHPPIAAARAEPLVEHLELRLDGIPHRILTTIAFDEPATQCPGTQPRRDSPRLHTAAPVLRIGANLSPASFDGEVVEVVAADGVRVTLRNDRTRQFTAVQISRLAASARPAGGTFPAGDAGVSPGLMLGSLTGEQLDQLAERAGHVREVLTGYKSGHPDQARPGEPRPGYRAAQPLKARYRAKAEELGITSRTAERWVAAYRSSGEAGLAGVRALAQVRIGLRVGAGDRRSRCRRMRYFVNAGQVGRQVM
jgi:hypothetical protein